MCDLVSLLVIDSISAVSAWGEHDQLTFTDNSKLLDLVNQKDTVELSIVNKFLVVRHYMSLIIRHFMVSIHTLTRILLYNQWCVIAIHNIRVDFVNTFDFSNILQ